MIHSSFQVRGLHLLLIIVETLWCHISVDSDTHSLTHSLTYYPVLFSPEFRLVARLRLFPPTQASTSLRASTHTAVTHLPSLPHVHPILAQAKKRHSCKISNQSFSPTPISSITSLTLTPRESAIRPMSPWPTSLISL